MDVWGEGQKLEFGSLGVYQPFTDINIRPLFRMKRMKEDGSKIIAPSITTTTTTCNHTCAVLEHVAGALT